MTIEEKQAAGERLEALVPLLAKFYPTGWRDFRAPTPYDWRSGLYIHMGGAFERFLLDGDMRFQDGKLRMQSMFGGGMLAVEVARQVSEIIHKPVAVTPMGEAEDESRHYWKISFELSDEEVCW